MQLINIGYGNLVSSDRILCIVSPKSAPISRLVKKAKEDGSLVDASEGRKTKGVIIADNGSVILSALTPVTIEGRMHNEKTDEETENGSK
ncbi:extracellular matrix/biofilm biosynthesis regulator RemA family protein [Candidatus Weimeria sp. HCP3S3_B5]|uniref:extracellular matrix/biofilm biosynthesis regulator RemA family protein n=1 Tax=Candidatus Weimeria sp. HCP3S3_B5 TaxID=3438871 RepID=UPI002A93865D|nr:DUF370 domain-containing protein [Lachnospiraceae bacterium]MDY6352355.1 DUF370 domain-containing protein [Lachnospiraceae bacterium]